MATQPFDEAVQAWIDGVGPNPFELTPMDMGSYYDNVAPPQDPDDIGFLDYQNKALTMGGKGLSMGADPAFITSLGTGAGGFSQADYDPTQEYESVSAPGYLQQQWWSQEGSNPITSFIAKEVSAPGGSAYSAEAKLRAAVADGSVSEELLMKYTDDSGNQVIDWKRIQKMAEGLENNLINDPTFTGFDEGGMPANIKSTPSEAQEYLDRTGTPNPYDTYDPDLLASVDQLRREGYNRDQAGGIKEEQEAAMRALLAATQGNSQAEAAQGAYERMVLENQELGRFNIDQGEASIIAPEGEMETFDPNFTDNDYMNDASFEGLASLADPTLSRSNTAYTSRIDPRRFTQSGDTPTRMAQMPGQSMRDTRALRGAARDATQAQFKARHTEEDDKYAALERQRMMAYITKAGYTPFNDVNRARQANIFGR